MRQLLNEKPRLCLGTAQLGLDYGVTNQGGQVSASIATQILSNASRYGIHYLDTAQAYGNSELVLGDNIRAIQNLKIISKLSPSKETSYDSSSAQQWERKFKSSCSRMNVSSIDTLLIHSSSELKKDGFEYLLDWLQGLKQRGLVNNIGVSIYESHELDNISPICLDVVQLPLSIFDQRLLADKTIQSLNANGTKVFARSIFMQGLLLTPSNLWPEWINRGLHQHMQRLEALLDTQQISVLDATLSFIKSQECLYALVFGVCKPIELEQIIVTWNNESTCGIGDFSSWRWNDGTSIDPRLWPSH